MGKQVRPARPVIRLAFREVRPFGRTAQFMYFFQDVPAANDLDILLLEQFHRLDTVQRRSFIELAGLLANMLQRAK